MSHLTPGQSARILQLLQARERALREEIRQGLLKSGEAHHKDMAGMVSDAGDESVANMLEDLELADVDRDVRELREVEGALARAGRADFGACADCGEPIGYARLEANPSASRCRAWVIARSMPSMLAYGLPGAPQIPSLSANRSAASPAVIAGVGIQRVSTVTPSFAAA